MANRLRGFLAALAGLAALVVLGLVLMAMFGAQGGVPVAQQPTACPTNQPYPVWTPRPTSPGTPFLVPTSTRPPPATATPIPPSPTIPPTTPIVVQPPAVRPIPPPDEYRIAYRQGNELRVMTPEGQEQETRVQASDVGMYFFVLDPPRPSPDGTRLACILIDVPPGVYGQPKVLDLYLFDLTTGRFQLIATKARLPTWSPDGRQLAFYEHPYLRRPTIARDVRIILRVLDLPSGQVRTLLSLRGETEYPSEIVWSPDGRQIAYVMNPQSWPEVWLLNADGSGQKGPLLSPKEYGYGTVSFTWSPTGEHLAFVSLAGEHPCCKETVSNLWIVGADGSNPTQLTRDLFAVKPSWSPDGKMLAFGAFEKKDEEQPYNIWLIQADGTGLRRLTNGPGHASDPRWSPDGRRLYYRQPRQRGSESKGIWMLDLQSGQATELAAEGEDLFILPGEKP